MIEPLTSMTFWRRLNVKRVVVSLITVSTLCLLIAPVVIGGDEEKSTVETTVAMVGEIAPDFTLVDTSGKEHSLSDYEGKFVVLEWVNFDCPFVKKHYHSGNMQALQTAYIKKGVVWLSICSSAPGKQGYFAGEDLTKRVASEESRSSAYLIDVDGKVGRMYQAQTTPNMYVISPDGELLYAGAIDSKASVKQEDIPESDNYVKLALDAALAGKEVATKVTKPYGCSVKY
jgi:peroxiredoxin